MHPSLSAIHSSALLAERLAEADRARTVRIEGGDWPLSNEGGRRRKGPIRIRRRS